jgi:hypothetical protein
MVNSHQILRLTIAAPKADKEVKSRSRPNSPVDAAQIQP